MRHPRKGTDEEQLANEFGASDGNGRRDDSIQTRFEEWLERNAELYAAIRRYAYQALRSGRRRFGIAAIIERVRWDVEIDSRGDEPFKINNDYRSRIVRRLIQEDPRFEDLFVTRELRAR